MKNKLFVSLWDVVKEGEPVQARKAQGNGLLRLERVQEPHGELHGNSGPARASVELARTWTSKCQRERCGGYGWVKAGSLLLPWGTGRAFNSNRERYSCRGRSASPSLQIRSCCRGPHQQQAWYRALFGGVPAQNKGKALRGAGQAQLLARHADTL